MDHTVTYDITSKQVSDILNGFLYLYQALDLAKETFRDESDFVVKLRMAVKYLKPIRDDVVARKDAYEDKLYDMFKATGEVNDFRSIWSIYSVSDLNSAHPFTGAKFLRHVDGQEPIPGNTYLDLWKAADLSIRKLNDMHIFIEGFRKVDSDVLELLTGS
jgi:hypothetical protein